MTSFTNPSTRYKICVISNSPYDLYKPWLQQESRRLIAQPQGYVLHNLPAILLCNTQVVFSPSPYVWPLTAMLAWWRHQMETFSALLALSEGNSPVTGEFPSQRPVTRSVDVFFDLHLNKRLSKPSRRWWSETASRSLWRHCNVSKTLFRIRPQNTHTVIAKGLRWTPLDFENVFLLA